MSKIKRNVVCMKWGTKFGPQYVNRLFNMVKKNLTLEHRFICFTDDANGLEKGIEVMPLPPVKFEKGAERGWNKLGILSDKLGDLQGQGLFLDLDIIILKNIDDFFKVPGEFLIIKDWDFNNYIGNSSVFRFDIGRHNDILENFEKNSTSIREQVRNEQAYLSLAIKEKNMLKYWDSSWCVSFKRHCLKPFPINYFKSPQLPKGAKILIFHGHPHPEEAYRGYTGKFGLRRVKPTLWLEDYWKV